MRAHRAGPLVELVEWARCQRVVVALVGLVLVLMVGSAAGFAVLRAERLRKRPRLA